MIKLHCKMKIICTEFCTKALPDTLTDLVYSASTLIMTLGYVTKFEKQIFNFMHSLYM